MTRFCPTAILAGCLLMLAGGATAAGPRTVALTGGNLVDLDGAATLEDAVVLVAGDRISAIGAAGEIDVPPDAQTVDLTGAWLIPGLMNMHVHPGLVLPGNMEAELANETEGELTLRMAAIARETLAAGVTTIRVPGDQRHGDLALARAIAKGHVDGPRIYSAGRPVSITGAEGAAETYHDGPWELVKAARGEIAAGASWIKIYISGGISTPGGDIAMPLMTPEEIRAVVDAAHRFGARVAAHSGSPAATAVAVEAGVDSIEHGYFLDRDVLRKMRAAGTWYVPTIVVSQPATQPFFEKIGAPDWFLARRDSVGREHWAALVAAIDVGVNIALGTDQHPAEPNDGTTATARELQYYVEAGMTPVEALRAATIEPARMLGAGDELGSLTVGKYADIVAVDADPTRDIKALRNILLVVKGGRIYVDRLGR